MTTKNHPGLFDQMGNIGCFKDPLKVFLAVFGLVSQDPFGFTVFYPSFFDVLEKLGNHQTRVLTRQLQSSRRRRDPCRKNTSTSQYVHPTHPISGEVLSRLNLILELDISQVSASENIHLNMVNPGDLFDFDIPKSTSPEIWPSAFSASGSHVCFYQWGFLRQIEVRKLCPFYF